MQYVVDHCLAFVREEQAYVTTDDLKTKCVYCSNYGISIVGRSLKACSHVLLQRGCYDSVEYDDQDLIALNAGPIRMQEPLNSPNEAEGLAGPGTGFDSNRGRIEGDEW
jgi:hypothetical protein